MDRTSCIAIVEANGEVKAIYCNDYGHPAHNGKLLLEHYNTEEKARGLISMGQLARLGALIKREDGQPYDFDSPANDTSIAYYRDMGERLEIWGYKSIEHFMEDLLYAVIPIEADFVYVWQNGAWGYSEVDTSADSTPETVIALKPLTPDVCQEQLQEPGKAISSKE